jgi:Tol biopolymer transport system component
LAEGWCDEVCVSPSGRQLAFVHLQPLGKPPGETDFPNWHREQLDLLDLQTGELQCVVDHPDPGPMGERLVVALSFSPDGSQLAYSNEPHTISDGWITCVDVATLQPTRLLSAPAGADGDGPTHWFPVWSAAGQQLAALCDDWSGQCYQGRRGVATYDVQTSRWRYYWLTRWGHYEPCSDLSYSADGTRIAYMREGRRGRPAVCVLNLRHGGVRRLAENAEMPRWRPRREALKP